MHKYYFYDHQINSDIKLTSCPSTSCHSKTLFEKQINISAAPIIEQNKNMNWYHDIHENGLVYARYGKLNDSFVIQLDNQINFILSPTGTQIHYDSTSNMHLVDIQALLLNTIIPFSLHLMGHLILHSASVVMQEKAIVFLGSPGAGKSTLTAGFVQNGYNFLSDDAVLIKKEKHQYLASPSFPEIRLSTLDGLPYEKIEQLSWGKNRISFKEQHNSNPHPIHGIYILNMTDKTSPFEITNYNRKLIPRILSNIYRLNIESKESIECELTQIIDLLESVPVYELTYPKGLKHIPQLIKLIHEHIQ